MVLSAVLKDRFLYYNYGNQKKNYRDLYPDEEEMQRMPPPPKGVMGVTPAIVGSVEATEVLKIICDFGDVLAGELWTIDCGHGNLTNFHYKGWFLT